MKEKIRRYIKVILDRKKFILYTSLRMSIMFLSLVSNIYIVRKLSLEDYGAFSITLMLVGLVTTLGFSWSSSSILYYGSREKAQFGNLNKTFWARNIIIFISLIIVTALTITFENRINDYIGIDVTILLLFWLYVSVAEDYLNQYYLAVKKQILSAMLSITAKIIYLFMILITDFDVIELIWLNIISHATVMFYIIGVNRKDIGKFEFDKEWFKEVWSFSIWQLFGFSGLYLINFGDTAVINYYMTTEDVGVYNAAYRLFTAFAGFAFVISSYYAGSISHYFAIDDKKSVTKFYYKERIVILFTSLLLHIFIILLSKQIITILYGERYEDAIWIFSILMVGSMFRYINVFYMLYYNVNKKHKLQQTINIIVAVTNIVLDIIFIQVWGLLGPAIATTLVTICSFVFSYYYCERRIKLV